jgi:hypothetical protein
MLSRIHRIILVVAVLGIYHLAAPDNSFAYLDPGTGSYILQMAVAAVLGSLFAIKMFWKRIIAFIKGLFGGDKNQEQQNG